MIASVLAAAMLLSAAACAKPDHNDTTSPANPAQSTAPALPAAPVFNTVGDVFDAMEEDMGCGYTDKTFTQVFLSQGTVLRATAALPEGLFGQIAALDMNADAYDEAFRTLTQGLKVEKIEDLSAGIPKQETLDGFAGKTGQDLLSDGWQIDSFTVRGKETSVIMYRGDYAIAVVLNGAFKGANKSGFNAAEAAGPLTVKSAAYHGLSKNAALPDAAE